MLAPAPHVRLVSGIVGRNPCPQCTSPPDYVAGAVLFPGREEARPDRFLVCWPCGRIRRVRRGEEWKSMRLPRGRRRH
jgi:hypothetical protein